MKPFSGLTFLALVGGCICLFLYMFVFLKEFSGWCIVKSCDCFMVPVMFLSFFGFLMAGDLALYFNV